MIVQLASKLKGQYQDLSEGQPYFVIGIEADDYRILNNAGQPYLYSPDIFTVVDDQQPEDWIVETGDSGEKYAYPPALNQAGFFEDFFDQKIETTAIFWQVMNKQLIHAA